MEEPPGVCGFILYETPNKKNVYNIPWETVQFQRINGIKYLVVEVVGTTQDGIESALSWCW